MVNKYMLVKMFFIKYKKMLVIREIQNKINVRQYFMFIRILKNKKKGR